MIRLPNLDVNSSFFIITDDINKFEIFTDVFDGLSFTELKEELEEVLDFSKISSEHLHDKIKGPRNIETYQKLSSEKKTD